VLVDFGILLVGKKFSMKIYFKPLGQPRGFFINFSQTFNNQWKRNLKEQLAKRPCLWEFVVDWASIST
jgi:hypothetical protein